MTAPEVTRDTPFVAIRKIEALSETARNAARATQTMLQVIENTVTDLRRFATSDPEFVDAASVADRMAFLQRLLVIGRDEAGRAEEALDAIEDAFLAMPSDFGSTAQEDR